MTTTIQKWGNSQGIRLPKPILEELNLKENQVVEILVEGDVILLKKINKPKAHKTLQQRLEEFYDKDIETIMKEHANDYQPEEIDWGRPVGKEVW